jgi:hypothetical protein
MNLHTFLDITRLIRSLDRQRQKVLKLVGAFLLGVLTLPEIVSGVDNNQRKEGQDYGLCQRSLAS